MNSERYNGYILIRGSSQPPYGGFEIVNRYREVSVSNEMCKTFIVAEVIIEVFFYYLKFLIKILLNLPQKGGRKEGLFMRNEERISEINEAKVAGREALFSLKQAENKLASARGWGIWDMLGGGLISTMMKHSRINDASVLMENARGKLRIFQRELRDVQVPTEFRMEIGEFLSFADYVFDGLIADCMVQSRIAEARKQIQDTILQVERILYNLEQMEDAIDVDYSEV